MKCMMEIKTIGNQNPKKCKKPCPSCIIFSGNKGKNITEWPKEKS